jgi:signal peptidase I
MTGNLLFILIAVFASVYFSTPKAARKKMVRTIIIALSFALTFRALVSAPYKIPTGSMIPTLKIGDFIFVNPSTVFLTLFTS